MDYIDRHYTYAFYRQNPADCGDYVLGTLRRWLSLCV